MPGRLLESFAPRHPSPASATAMDHIKRSSLSGFASHIKPHGDRRHQSKERANINAAAASRSPSLRPVKAPANSMSIVIESPPNVFYGPASQSSGALFSGQLRVKVVEPELTITRFMMDFHACITALKPVAKDCPECACKTTSLFRWTFLSEPKTLAAGEHSFPFSYLIPGHLPATTIGHLARLEYVLDATAKTTSPSGNITLHHPLDLARALAPAPERTSLRIFPPTNLTAHLQFFPIIHPIGDSNLFLRITGITSRSPNDPEIQLRWRLRKMSWRLEETEKMISPACSRHAGKVGGEGRGVLHEDVRVVGHAEMREGWKTDFSDDHIEMEFPLGANSGRPLCDVESPTGLSLSHNIVIELVIAEEWAPKKHPNRPTPTGAARVLRANFQVAITERAGMGISWDEEQPPTYDDVPASPPLYSTGSLTKPTSGEVAPLDEMESLSLADMQRRPLNPRTTDGNRGRPTERVASPESRARELRSIMEEGGDDEYNRPPTPERQRSSSPPRAGSSA